MEIKVKSGTAVIINPAPFEDALALNNAVGNPVLGLNVDIKPDFDLDSAANFHYMTVVASQAAVQALVMKCLVRCTYNGQKITQATFEAEGAREDYFEIAVACVRENLAPFVASLFSQFSVLVEARQKKHANTQK